MKNYSPLFFLSALGPGGMTVAFYMYFMFMTPHKGIPMATYDTLVPFFQETSIFGKVAMVLITLAILYFAYKHIALTIKNTKEWMKFKKSPAYAEAKGTLKEITFMALPLTYAMTINVMFVLGAMLVPGLWSVIEYMFPLAIIGFMVVGYYAFKIFAEYFIPFFIHGNTAWEENNNFSQLLSVFAFVMIGVGFAAPGAMSHIKAVNAFALFASFMFMGAAIGLLILKFVLGFHSVVKHGITKQAAPTLWILIPILTLIGITFFRESFGLAHHFSEGEADVKAFAFTLTGSFFAVQTLIGGFGYLVMKKLGYFEDYIHGKEKDPTSFALICPGVAYSVFGMFFIHWGLIYNDVIESFSIAHILLLVPLAIVQYKTIATMLRLNKKFGL